MAKSASDCKSSLGFSITAALVSKCCEKSKTAALCTDKWSVISKSGLAQSTSPTPLSELVWVGIENTRKTDENRIYKLRQSSITQRRIIRLCSNVVSTLIT